MTKHSDICPHCGKPISNENRATTSKSVVTRHATEVTEEREYDHRGIPLPRRTRMGGIITPQ